MYLSFRLPDGKIVEGNVSKNAVIIGRSNKGDFVVPDESLSRSHCLVEIHDSRFYVTDLGSANGVFVDGNRIPPNQKTPFTTFMQLAIGQIEFTVQEEVDQQTFEHPNQNLSKQSNHSSGLTSTSTKIHSLPNARPASRYHQPSKEKSSSAVDPKILGIFILLAMGGLFYFFKGGNEGADQQLDMNTDAAGTQIASVRPAANIVKSQVAEEFPSIDIYLNLESKKSCVSKSEECKEFKLAEEEGEGIVIQDSEAFVFMKPTSFFELSHLSFLSGQPYGQELISHYVVLTSSLMTQMYAREIDQIHLIMLDENKKMVKVFRYHVHQFNEGNENRFRYIEFLNNAFLTHRLEEVTTLLQKEIPAKDLTSN